jgi:hypothetical protein
MLICASEEMLIFIVRGEDAVIYCERRGDADMKCIIIIAAYHLVHIQFASLRIVIARHSLTGFRSLLRRHGSRIVCGSRSSRLPSPPLKSLTRSGAL